MKLFTLSTLFSLSVIALTPVKANTHQYVVTLTHEALEELDGRAIDKNKIEDMIYLGRAIKKLQLGTYNTTSKQYTGIYLYKNKKCGLKQLVDIEQEEEKKYGHLKQANRPVYDQHMHGLHELLHKAIKDFGDITRPFLGKAHLVKPLMIKLIKEWCTKTKRYNSGLAAWSHLQGNEQEAFIQNVKTFYDLDVFCTDLTGFLASMIKSCPKAYNQYMQMLKQNKLPKI